MKFIISDVNHKINYSIVFNQLIIFLLMFLVKQKV